jgi:hypothetical protein
MLRYTTITRAVFAGYLVEKLQRLAAWLSIWFGYLADDWRLFELFGLGATARAVRALVNEVRASGRLLREAAPTLNPAFVTRVSGGRAVQAEAG